MRNLSVGVITGGHAFDVMGFHALFRSFEGLDCYTQAVEEWAVDFGRYGHRYDVLVFYTMHTALPQEGPGGKRTRAAVDALKEGPGVVILHHGILAFKQDPVWDAMVGMTGRTIEGYKHDEHLAVHVVDPTHPITEGLSDFEIVDETYDFRDVENDGSDVLLAVDHPNSMSTMAWTSMYEKTRVFNLVLGHDDQAWSNVNFRRVLERGITWVSGDG